MDGIERLCGSFDNETSADIVSMRIPIHVKTLILT